ncbi:MAG: FkbM family methyltransferase [Nitrosomonas sp.]|nr:FkbM family methyltransferase [Nitrosomonas sp.]
MYSIECQIGDNRYTLSSDDDYLQANAIFEPDTVDILSKLINNQMVIVDVGANIGMTTILFSNLGKMVHSFEASPTTYSLLKKNIESNQLENTKLNCVGLGSKEFETEITFATANRSGGFVSNQTSASVEGHTVESVKISRGDDYFLNESNPIAFDFIKIDVEGFELDVLNGLRKSIYKYKPSAFIELNHWCLNAFQRISVPEFFDFLLDMFPIVLAVQGREYADLNDRDDRYKVMYEHIIQFKFGNLVCAFKEEQLESFYSNYSHF